MDLKLKYGWEKKGTNCHHQEKEGYTVDSFSDEVSTTREKECEKII